MSDHTAESAQLADVLPLWPEKRKRSEECSCGRRHGERTPSRMKPVCPICDTIHCPSDVVALGRFQSNGPLGYVPRVEPCDGVYATRQEAEEAACAVRAARRAARGGHQ